MNAVQLRESFTKLVPLARVTGGILLVGCVLPVFFPSFTEYFGLVAGKTIPLVWNVLSSAFVENSLISIFFTLPLAVYLTHFLDPIQGQRGTIQILIATIIGSGTLTFLTLVIVYYVIAVAGAGSAMDKMVVSLLYTPVCGFQGAISGMLVAVKQAIPESEVKVFNRMRFKVKLLPFAFVLVLSIIAFISGHVLKYIPFVLYGTYCAWFYLRYFHSMPDSGLRGDPSEQFDFASFFPDRLQPAVGMIAFQCHKLFRVAAWTPQSNSVATGADDEGSVESNSVEATRRRERGMKALEERLSSKQAIKAPKSHVTATELKHAESKAEVGHRLSPRRA